MMLDVKKVAVVAATIMLLVTAAAGVVSADSADYSMLDQTTEFLSSVVGLDMTKYSLIVPSPPPGYENRPMPTPPFSDPADSEGVDFEGPSYDFESSEGELHTMSIFYNGHMSSLKIYLDDPYIYSGSPPTDILNQARNMLQRYQTLLSQKYAMENSFLTPMQNILNSVAELSPASVTVGNITFQVSKSEDRTRIQWVYTDGGIAMDRKRVDFSFRNNTFESFSDTWSIYKVSGLSAISSEEATKIALEAAQKVELHIGHADGSVETVHVPDLSNASYDVNLAIVPYRNSEGDFPSTIARDPLTLYPLWQFIFLFKEKIGGDIGVQVGVWGDTKDIAYASGYGVLGDFGTPSNQESEEQTQFNLLDPPVLAVAICLAVVIAVAITAIALRRKNQRNQQA